VGVGVVVSLRILRGGGANDDRSGEDKIFGNGDEETKGENDEQKAED
jgi:hypothetical protein